MKMDFRKKVFINKEFQYKFISTFIAISFIIIVLNLVSNLYFLNEFSELGKSVGFNSEHPYFKFLNLQKKKIILITSTFSFIILAFVTIFSLYYSHRIAGPIYRLRKYFDESNPDISMPEIQFRKNDFFSELPEAINSFLGKIKTANSKNQK